MSVGIPRSTVPAGSMCPNYHTCMAWVRAHHHVRLPKSQARFGCCCICARGLQIHPFTGCGASNAGFCSLLCSPFCGRLCGNLLAWASSTTTRFASSNFGTSHRAELVRVGVDTWTARVSRSSRQAGSAAWELVRRLRVTLVFRARVGQTFANVFANRLHTVCRGL